MGVSLQEGKAVVEWLWSEIDSCNPVHDLRKVLEGELAQRSDLAKRVLEHERQIHEIDNMPDAQRVRLHYWMSLSVGN